MKRHTFVERLRIGCDATATAADCSERWEGNVAALMLLQGQPIRGRLELLRSHIVICANDARVLASIPLKTITAMQRKKEIHFPSRTFAEPPLFRCSVDMATAGGTAAIIVEGAEGIHVTKAIEKLWLYENEAIESEREERMLRSYALGDAIHALSLLPLDVDCTLVQQIVRGQVESFDQPVVMRVDEDFTFSIIYRPSDIHDAQNLRAMSVNLDQVNLVWAKGDDLRICFRDGRTFLATGASSNAENVKMLLCVFVANAATMVYRATEDSKRINSLTYDEAFKLFQHYCIVDANLDGQLSQIEFLNALGPILGNEKVLPRALYSLFDCFGANKIRFFEYLHGCRVLLKGDVDDRLKFIFHLFDIKREQQINFQQFLDGMNILSAAVTLDIPRGQTMETFAFKLFDEIDTNRNGFIDFKEFSQAMTRSGGIVSALQNIVNSADKKDGPRRVMSFGHSQWTQITQILAGIQMAVTHPDATAVVTPAAFQAKLTYNCNAGSLFGKDAQRSSGILKRRSDNDVVFNDYCPAVFHSIRTQFGISDDDYLKSLGLTQLKRNLIFGNLSSLFEMSSSGRSGSFFYVSHDGKYILKTIPMAESQTLRKMLPQYHEHVTKNPNTFLTRFTGLHALLKGSTKVIFVVMANIFLNKIPIHETFDLKGSSVNRSTPMNQRDTGVALKDNDFDQRKLQVLPNTRTEILKQVEQDSLLLSGMNLNDYSFLLGIHNSDVPVDVNAVANNACPPPMHSQFQQFLGGIPSRDRTQVFYIGVIDILTDYGLRKMGEHGIKSVIYDGSQVSCVPPQDYHKRFVEYIESILVSN